MTPSDSFTQDYQAWLKALKAQINRARSRTALSANRSLIEFYWELGKTLAEKQAQSQWGDKVIDQVAKDLKREFDSLKGLSATNLKYCKRFYLFYTSIGQQAVDQLAQSKGGPPLSELVKELPWGHNILIFTKVDTLESAYFYLVQTLTNGWNREVLALQLKTDLFHRQGAAITNFQDTLPTPHSELAQATLKDPYIFDFMALDKPYREKELEDQLVGQVSRFLLELGKGFAFMGRQHHLEVAGQDYYLDLLFYHVVLKCYVVIELKNTRFKPEYAGKLNFYLSAVDSLMKQETDHQTIGILLCRDKNNIEVEFALRGLTQPMGVSEFTLTEILPEELKSSLPTIEEIEQTLE